MGRALTDAENDVLAALLKQIHGFEVRNQRRLNYLDGEHRLQKLPVSIPASMRGLEIPVGWARKAVEKFSARLQPQFYTTKTATSLLDDVELVFQENQMELLEPMAIEAAAALGVSFVFTTAREPGSTDLLITARDALSASVILDPRTRDVVAAVEKVDKDQVNLYLLDKTLTIARSNATSVWEVIDEAPNLTGRVLCTPYVHGATLHRPLGVSRITRPLMGLTDLGVRVFLRQEVASEFHIAPRGILVDAYESAFEGTGSDGVRTGWEQTLGSIWALESMIDDETGERVTPRVEWSPQISMQPFTDQFRLVAAAVSGETSIPLSYLGVVQDSNPTSAEAIQAAETDLVREVKGKMPSFNAGRNSLALDVISALHGEITPEMKGSLRGLTPRWADPRTRSISEQSQFVAMQCQVGNFKPGTESTLQQLPIDPVDAKRIAQENRENADAGLLNKLGADSDLVDSASAANLFSN